MKNIWPWAVLVFRAEVGRDIHEEELQVQRGGHYRLGLGNYKRYPQTFRPGLSLLRLRTSHLAVQCHSGLSIRLGFSPDGVLVSIRDIVDRGTRTRGGGWLLRSWARQTPRPSWVNSESPIDCPPRK